MVTIQDLKISQLKAVLEILGDEIEDLTEDLFQDWNDKLHTEICFLKRLKSKVEITREKAFEIGLTEKEYNYLKEMKEAYTL